MRFVLSNSLIYQRNAIFRGFEKTRPGARKRGSLNQKGFLYMIAPARLSPWRFAAGVRVSCINLVYLVHFAHRVRNTLSHNVTGNQVGGEPRWQQALQHPTTWNSPSGRRPRRRSTASSSNRLTIISTWVRLRFTSGFRRPSGGWAIGS